MSQKSKRSQSPEAAPPLFYAPDAAALPFDENAPSEHFLTLSVEESRHALQVLRLRHDDAVGLFDGCGRFYDGRLDIPTGQRRQASVRVASARESEAEPSMRLVLLVALLKGKKSDFLVQKAVELGVGALYFFPSERSVPRFRKERETVACLRRWNKIVVSACKQSRRATLMPTGLLDSLEQALDAASPEGARLAFWEEEDAARSATRVTPMASESRDIAALIGPEGGFSVEEIELARCARFQTRSLGPRVLRAETAALAVAAILLHQGGELGSVL